MIHIACVKTESSIEGVHPVIHRIYVMCPICNKSSIYYKYEREFAEGTCPKACIYCKHAFPQVNGMITEGSDTALLHKVTFYGGG
jgi:hypothetical protein